ncbi:C2H2 finger domain protein [Aspergillus sclerotialis]|uniref:C2H2 finger domain protein n=1 Tax=Aspergillus sclerotialis TaxID=2070753 RepID=A0A3A2ZET2_9EURO|nr:C2H2 finger domain protein [Aspergillus sclerotialis]
MLALEPSRQQQLPYFQSYTMDPTLMDPFAFQADQLGAFAQNQDPSRVSQSYYDTPPVYAESGSDMNKASNMLSTTPPSMATSQPAEHAMPGLSSASGPSIASASSSAIGSPYSGNVQAFPENWVDTNHGLGLQAAVVGDLFPNDYMGGSVDPEGLYPKKAQDNYVGESQVISSNMQSTFPLSASHHEAPSSLGAPSFKSSSKYTFSCFGLVPPSTQERFGCEGDI